MNEPVVGVDLGGTRIKVGLCAADGALIGTTSLPTEAEKGPEHVVDQIIRGIREVTGRDGPYAAVGIGAPGSVNLERTTISHPPNFPGWSRVNVSQSVQAEFGTRIPVIVENDANVAAMGSLLAGAGRDFDSFVMITLGTGVGGAVIYQRKLFRGTTGAAGEIGHVSIDYEGPVDRAGISGVIEAYVGQRFLSRHAWYRLINRPESIVHELTGGERSKLTPEVLFQAASRGDIAAAEILSWAGHKLGWGLGSVVNILDIRKIVVGGGVSAAGDYILEPARQALHDAVMPGLRDGLELRRETLGNEVGMLGAAHLAFEHLDEHDSH